MSSDAPAEMSDAEVLAAAVNIAANKLHKEGNQIIQISSELSAIPNIWFKSGDTAQYVVVTFARYPKTAEPPLNAADIHRSLTEEGYSGYWVGVSLANEYDLFDPESDTGLPLWKDAGLLPKIGAMVPMSDIQQ
ncbi:MAG: hypothetical protein HWE12_07820 [Oceanospirillaceae bacterium]|nr:hypothetical protein [Oceanospirillaceae bacterium]